MMLRYRRTMSKNKNGYMYFHVPAEIAREFDHKQIWLEFEDGVLKVYSTEIK
jgi:hypothetical protein